MSNIPQNQDSLGEKLKATDSKNSDIIYNGTKAATSFIPALGPVAEFFIDSYIGPPATKRMRNFLDALVEELNELKSKIESVNFENPLFQTTFMQACQIVSRTHGEQKLEALRNVVLNSSIPSPLEDDILAMFLNWIDGFTERHIFILKRLHDLDSYVPGELETYFPRWEQEMAINNQVLKDLADRGLIILKEDYIRKENGDIFRQKNGISRLPPTPPGMDNASKRMIEKDRKIKDDRHQEDMGKLIKKSRSLRQPSKTTELGKQFIEFIKSPSIQT
jgi:hypothetical protein